MSDAMRGDITDRLRGRYPVGPKLPNGEPEFGWREHATIIAMQEGSERDSAAVRVQRMPIMEEAAKEIERLRAALEEIAKPSNWDGIYLPKIDCQVIALKALTVPHGKS